MSAVCRVGDLSSGHCFSPFPILTGSSNVFTNGIATSTIGSAYPVHSCGDSSHDGTQAAGSPNVFVNGKAITRVGDSVSCGDTAANGSSNVFAN